jgi:hypothetical protein
MIERLSQDIFLKIMLMPSTQRMEVFEALGASEMHDTENKSEFRLWQRVNRDMPNEWRHQEM